ncbi:MAG: CHAT domain-containing protein, partial [Rhodocyclaceae bacterium]|nr:CHAT domain-containing protein [Rhodocyclaceae bacterium]
HKKAFGQYLKLIETGQCSLPTQRPLARGERETVYAPAPVLAPALYPTPDDIIDLALGAGRPAPSVATSLAPITIELVHGSLAGARAPVIAGAYTNDAVSGSLAFLDQHLDQRLSKAFAAGRYPNRLGDVLVFRQSAPTARPGGAIVVGLGPVGMLKPGDLTSALSQGMLEYARLCEEQAASGATMELQLSAIAVGTGFAGLSVQAGMNCFADALGQVQLSLRNAYGEKRLTIGRLTLFEEEESRVIAAAEALLALAADARYAEFLAYDGHIGLAPGAYRNYGGDRGGSGGWAQVHVVKAEDGGLRFTLVTDRARNEVEEEPNQRQAVDGLIRGATQNCADQPGLSRTLFELMVPNRFKDGLAGLGGLVLSLDADAATYPWELMRDLAQDIAPPLATRVGLVRQLASPRGRGRVPTVKERRALLVGDTQSGFSELPGAMDEARTLNDLFAGRGFDTRLLIKPAGPAVMEHLFDGQYMAIHLAAHGVVSDDAQGYTGMVLGNDQFLTTAQVKMLSRVPEVVFLNCCHLGNMSADAQPRWGKLAANLATEFIEMGCKAVVAAGWAVEDAAAGTFAKEFWQAMLGGTSFGAAVLLARQRTFQRHPAANTWGAYQAYGDPGYVFAGALKDDDMAAASPAAALPVYLLKGQALADLERLKARLGASAGAEQAKYRKRLEAMEAAIRPRYFGDGEVRQLLGDIWAHMGQRQLAIEHYRAAVLQENGGASLKAAEQLANLEIRQAADANFRPNDKKQSVALFRSGKRRLESLLELGKTVERLSLMASYWKHLESTQELGSDDAQKSLDHMLNWYRKASDLSHAQDGDRDYYPTLNYLDGLLLRAAQGDRTDFDAIDLPDWSADACRNAARRYAVERSFFHDYARVDALRIEMLWPLVKKAAVLDATSPAMLALLAEHQAIFRMHGGENEKNSVLKQLKWLRARLPEGALKTTLENWMGLVEGGSAPA